MVLSGLVGRCGSGDGGAGSSRETPGPGLPPPPARRSRRLVLGGAGPRLLCRCARASGWVEVNALWGR